MKKHYETHVEDTDKLISVAGPVLDYKSWYERYRKLMEEQAQRKYGLYTPTSKGDDDFPSIPGMIARYSAKGLTNEQMSNNPVWKDLTGNGHDLQMKNFAWSGMSGVGGYLENFRTWAFDKSRGEATVTDSKIHITKTTIARFPLLYKVNIDKKFQIKVTGVNSQHVIKIDGLGDFLISEDGYYDIDKISYVGFGTTKILDSCDITIELLPVYPDSIVFDGVDDYGICENFPILTKEKGYTVVALRHLLGNGGAMLSKRTINPGSGAFVVDKDNNNIKYSYSFGTATKVSINRNNPFVYQTSNSYMGQAIITGYAKDNSYIIVGAGLIDISNSRITEYIKCSIHELVILDHDATEEELTKIKNYFIKTYPWLFFDQAWTVVGKSNEDTDRATIANITGNDNNLVLSNFGFAGNSGYGEYAQNFNDYSFGNLKTITYTRTAASMQLDVPAGSSENIYSNANGEAPIGFVYNFNLKITGLKTGNLLSISQGTSLDNIIANINKDGVYNIKATVDDSWNQRRIYFWIRNSNGPETTLSIEQIPDHEGYLVTDGVDDKVYSSAFALGNKYTVVGENEILSNTYANAGIVKVSSFFVFPNSIGVTCYINRQSKGIAIPSKRLKSICSDGRIYYDDWAEAIDVGGNMESNNPTPLFLGYQKNEFTRFAFKNLAIYNNKTLSKEDMIKAYIYLQTLKAK